MKKWVIKENWPVWAELKRKSRNSDILVELENKNNWYYENNTFDTYIQALSYLKAHVQEELVKLSKYVQEDEDRIRRLMIKLGHSKAEAEELCKLKELVRKELFEARVKSEKLYSPTAGCGRLK